MMITCCCVKINTSIASRRLNLIEGFLPVPNRDTDERLEPSAPPYEMKNVNRHTEPDRATEYLLNEIRRQEERKMKY